MQFVRICSVKDCHIFTDIIIIIYKSKFQKDLESKYFKSVFSE